MTGWLVNLDRSSPISRHLSLCSEAKDSTYVRDVDLKSWSEIPGKFLLLRERNSIAISILLEGGVGRKASARTNVILATASFSVRKLFAITKGRKGCLDDRHEKAKGKTNNLAMLIGLYCHSDSIASECFP